MQKSEFKQVRELHELADRIKDLKTLGQAAKSAGTTIHFTLGTYYVDDRGTDLQNAYEAVTAALDKLEKICYKENQKIDSKIWKIYESIRPADDA